MSHSCEIEANTEALRAEVENLRKGWGHMRDATNMWANRTIEQEDRAVAAEARAERLAEELQAVVADMREWGEPAKGAHIERIQRRLEDALREFDQEKNGHIISI